MKRGKRIFLYLVVIAVISIFLAFPVVSQGKTTERILLFHSHIIVHENSSMTVRETITVRSAAMEIKRGIYRDFPTRYRDRSGNRYVVDFNVTEVLRDGKPEGYHFSNPKNGKRIYIGRENVSLPQGEYTYTLSYKINRQFGFF